MNMEEYRRECRRRGVKRADWQKAAELSEQWLAEQEKNTRHESHDLFRAYCKWMDQRNNCRSFSSNVGLMLWLRGKGYIDRLQGEKRFIWLILKD